MISAIYYLVMITLGQTLVKKYSNWKSVKVRSLKLLLCFASNVSETTALVIITVKFPVKETELNQIRIQDFPRLLRVWGQTYLRIPCSLYKGWRY